MNQVVKEEKDENQKLEAQFVLRLPLDMANNIRKVLHTKPKKIKKYMNIQMNPELREGLITFNKVSCPLVLVDLPTVVESLKTTDGKMFFKTADIHQMYLACDPKIFENKIDDGKKPSKKYLWAHGLTPPLKNVRKNRYRKTLKNKNPLDGPEIEKEVKWLLKMDNDAIAVRWELVFDEKYIQKNEALNLDEKEVFGEISDSISDDEYQNLLQDDEDDLEENDLTSNFQEFSNSF